jgi:hypothetical protein
LGTILPKLGELVLVGATIGVVSSLARRNLDLVLLTWSVAFASLMDLDHLPSALGLGEPIRPAHSIGFFLLVVAALAVFIRKQPEVEFAFAASFFGHLAADTGIFAPLAPLSFDYVPLDAYRLPFAIGAVVFALIAGLARRRKQDRGTLPSDGQVMHFTSSANGSLKCEACYLRSRTEFLDASLLSSSSNVRSGSSSLFAAASTTRSLYSR